MSPQPVFLFSLPRSGSTLLQRMLSLHEDINTKSELWFLLPHIEALKNRYTFSLYSNISLKNATIGLLEQLPNGEDDYYRAIRALSESIYERLAVSNERYVLDKTPRYYLVIKEIAKIFPEAKYIFLFRNPLSIAASVIESFNKGRLGDYRHNIDLYLGPEMLRDGFLHIKDRSIVIHYEELLHNPFKALSAVCEYLDIPYNEKLITEFSSVPVGIFGDQKGTKKFSSLEPARVQNWTKVFSTNYRKRYLKRYLENLGEYTVSTFGYDYDDLLSQIDAHETHYSMAFTDRVNLLKCSLMIQLEGVVFKEKLKNKKEGVFNYSCLH